MFLFDLHADHFEASVRIKDMRVLQWQMDTVIVHLWTALSVRSPDSLILI